MATYSECEDAIMEAVNSSQELRALVESVPDRVADTVQALVPVDTGTAKASIEVKARRSAYKKLSLRKVPIGKVVSDDDYQKIAAIEFGRGAEAEHGETPEFAPFRRGAHMWKFKKL